MMENFGITTANATPMIAMMTTTTNAMIQVIEALVFSTLIIAPTPIIGAYTTIRMNMTSTCWIC